MDQPRHHSKSTTVRRARAFLTATVLAIGILLSATAAPAAAQDVGGNGNPYYNCPNGYTVASSNIIKNGTVIGVVELRWSWTCGGNWTRTISYVGSRPLYSNLQYDPWNGTSAWATDTATANWSPYLIVSPTQAMCGYGDIEIDGGLYGAWVCG